MGPDINTSYLLPKREELLTRVERGLNRTTVAAVVSMVASGVAVLTYNKATNSWFNDFEPLLSEAVVATALSTYGYAFVQYVQAGVNRFRSVHADMDTDMFAQIEYTTPTYSTVSEIVRNLPALARRMTEVSVQTPHQVSYGHNRTGDKIEELVFDGETLRLTLSESSYGGNPYYISSDYAGQNEANLTGDLEGAILFDTATSRHDSRSDEVIEFALRQNHFKRQIVHPAKYKGRKDMYAQLKKAYVAMHEINWVDPIAALDGLVQTDVSANDYSPLRRHRLLLRAVDYLVAKDSTPEETKMEIAGQVRRLAQMYPITELILMAPHIMIKHVLSAEDREAISLQVDLVGSTMGHNISIFERESRDRTMVFNGATFVSLKTTKALRADEHLDFLKPQFQLIVQVQKLLRPDKE